MGYLCHAVWVTWSGTEGVMRCGPCGVVYTEPRGPLKGPGVLLKDPKIL